MVTNDYCEQRNIIFLNQAGSQGPEDQGIPKMIYTPNIEELLVSGNSPGRIETIAEVAEGGPRATAPSSSTSCRSRIFLVARGDVR